MDFHTARFRDLAAPVSRSTIHREDTGIQASEHAKNHEQGEQESHLRVAGSSPCRQNSSGISTHFRALPETHLVVSVRAE